MRRLRGAEATWEDRKVCLGKSECVLGHSVGLSVCYWIILDCVLVGHLPRILDRKVCELDGFVVLSSSTP